MKKIRNNKKQFIIVFAVVFLNLLIIDSSESMQAALNSSQHARKLTPKCLDFLEQQKKLFSVVPKSTRSGEGETVNFRPPKIAPLKMSAAKHPSLLLKAKKQFNRDFRVFADSDRNDPLSTDEKKSFNALANYLGC
jgi:hypothetical protein